jgi:hypothetical protein
MCARVHGGVHICLRGCVSVCVCVRERAQRTPFTNWLGLLCAAYETGDAVLWHSTDSLTLGLDAAVLAGLHYGRSASHASS